MYTDEDLDSAVEKGIFTRESVVNFRTQLELSKNTSVVDEENFRLITGFNDIFVVLACALLLFSSVSALRALNEFLALAVFSMLAWGLAEFFVLKRKMALPAIFLLLCFVGGIFALGKSAFAATAEISYVLASVLAALAAYFHYRRFQIPITVAAGTIAITGFLIALILSVFSGSESWILATVFVCGVFAFILAMYWDASDLERKTNRSDVAFWLHLLSAPLIVHPVFTFLGILDGQEGLSSMIVVVLLYLLMTFISIVVDRRAFMVSSLIYVLYAISNLLKAYGVVGYGFAITGVCIGSALLLLSAFWHPVRSRLVGYLPAGVFEYIPKTS